MCCNSYDYFIYKKLVLAFKVLKNITSEYMYLNVLSFVSKLVLEQQDVEIHILALYMYQLFKVNTINSIL